MQNKKVCFFINTLSCGGAEHQLVVLANFLVEKGYNVSIATYGDVVDHYKINDKIHRIYIAPNKKKLAKLGAIWKFGLTVKADCIISFCQRNSCFILPSLIFRSRKNLKVVCGERNLSQGKSNWIEHILFKYLYKRADYIVPNSYSQKAYILNKCPEYAHKVVTITNYTDTYQFTYNQPPNNKIRRIGIFCRYEEQKNCLRFVRAVRRVFEHMGNSFIIEWYGNKKFRNATLRDYYDQLISLVEELELSQIIHMNDSVKNVSTLLHNFDIICLPSLFEGFSNSIAEAICCGKPMVVSNVSDNPLMVHNGENGFLFNPFDEREIASSLIRILSRSSEELRMMGVKSRSIAEHLFDKKIFVESYTQLIKE